MPHYYTSSSCKNIITGYATMLSNYKERGWDLHLLSFMFKQLRGSRKAILAQMIQEVQRFYGRLLTRVVRKPHCKAARGRLPVLVAFPDLPVFKLGKPPVVDVTCNGGLHFHAVAALPPMSRLRERLDEHLSNHQIEYLVPGSPLRRIHVEPIRHNLPEVVDYLLKGLKKGWYSPDEVLLLPRVETEL
jgi:hypothetical protein